MARFPIIALLSIALAGPSGCSALFVEGPPPDHARLRYFDCTSSRAAQTVDMILGGVMVLAALGAAQDSSAEPSARLTVNLVAAGLVGSAIYGTVRTDSCREAKSDLMARMGDSDTPIAPSRPRVDPWLAGGPAPQAPPSVWDAPPATNKTTVSAPPEQTTPVIQPTPHQAPKSPPP